MTAQNLMATTALREDQVLIHDNEDTYTEPFCKPFMNGFFGQAKGTQLCWSRDALQTGQHKSEEKLYPDKMLKTTASAKSKSLMMASVDLLSGFWCRGPRVEVWALTLPFEALYLPTHPGSSDLILSRYYSGALVAALSSLFTAKAAIEHTLSQLEKGSDSPPPKQWRRGTYHVEPIQLHDSVSMPEEVKMLKQVKRGDNKENRNI
ncbi:hypothetical protein BGZ94_004583 [Podila epigama]|nr:hypothetical protein BGZ94_004583 [Podila epigama]